MTKVIEVTQEDIDHGMRSNCEACPIALAAQRMLDASAWVGPTLLYYGKPEREITLPPEAKRFVADFDNRRPVSPFTFTIELSD